MDLTHAIQVGSARQPMTQPTITPRIQKLALLNVCLGQFMSAVDSRSVIVALPTISLDYGLSLAGVEGVPLGYQMTIVGLGVGMARLRGTVGRQKDFGV